MDEQNQLVAFKSIANFINDLADVFGDEFNNLKLYSHLIGKTTLSHEKAIEKHVNSFKDFATTNRDGIEKKDISLFVDTEIKYSPNVFLDIKYIFDKADTDTTEIIWQHILTISAVVDPTGHAKKILREENSTNPTNETEFLSDIIDKIETNVGDTNVNDPMSAVNEIMKSGVFSELIQGMGSGIQNGNLDMNKLMGTVQNMMTKIQDDPEPNINSVLSGLQADICETSDGDNGNVNDTKATPIMNDEDINNITSMMQPMLKNMTESMNNNDGGEPDIMAMFGPVMNMMTQNMAQGMAGDPTGSLPQMSNSIEDTINAQLEQSKQNGTFPSGDSK